MKFQKRAKRVANALRVKLGIPDSQPPHVGVILGTGWGDTLKIENEESLQMSALPGFDEIGALPGHKRLVCYGTIGDKSVIALRGRVHLNERPCHEPTVLAVRMQAQMLVELGVRNFIITNAAGALGQKCQAGDVIVVDGFVSLFMQGLPGFAAEFCSPDDVLDPALQELAMQSGVKHLGKGESFGPTVRQGGYVPVRGPFFEGRKYDKAILRSTGASCVGMSSLPETAVIAATSKSRVLVLSYITNSDTEVHSHDENVHRAKADAPKLGAMLTEIIEQSSSRVTTPLPEAV